MQLHVEILVQTELYYLSPLLIMANQQQTQNLTYQLEVNAQ